MHEKASDAGNKSRRLTHWTWPLFIVAALIFLAAAFFLEENWRGAFVWRHTKAELEARHEILDWQHYLPIAPPDARNMMKVPGMEETFVKGGTGGLIISTSPQRAVGSSNYIRFGEIEVVTNQNAATISLEKLRTNAVARREFLRAFAGRGVESPSMIYLSERAPKADVKRVFVTSPAPIDPGELQKEKGIFQPLTVKADRISDSVIALSCEQGHWYTAAEYIAWSAGQSNLFAMLDEASKRPECWLPGDYSIPFSSPIANFVAVRMAAQLLASRAQAFLLLNRADEAYADLQRIDTLNRIVTAKPMTLVSAMVHVAICGLQTSVISDGFAMGAWQEHHWRGFIDSYSKTQLLPQVAESLRTGERAGILELVDQLSGDAARRVLTQDVSLKPISEFFEVAPRGWARLNAAFYARAVQRQIDFFDGGTIIDPQQVKRLNDEIIADLDRAMSPTHMIARIAVINVNKAAQSTVGSQTAINEVLIACALELYHKDTGSYPETLAELTAKYLPRIPSDLILGKPLRYQKRNNGEYALYSTGWNAVDDVAPLLANPKTPMLEIFESNAAADDWVWRGVPETAVK